MEALDKGKICETQPGFGKRHVTVALLFFAYVASYYCQGCLSVAIVSMTSTNTSNPNFPTYSWHETQKNVIISSFFGGFVIGSLVAGEFIRSAGPSFVLYVAFLGPALLSAVTELCSSTGGWLFMSINRVLIGLMTGFQEPLFFLIDSKWIPLNERNFLLNVIFSGCPIGFALSAQTAGILAEGVTGWPSIFYLAAVLQALFCVFWKFFGYFSPQDHPTINEKEKAYIVKSLSLNPDRKLRKVPWKCIMKSLPVYAAIAAEIGQGIMVAILTNEVAIFIDSIQHISLSLNGILTSLPFFFLLVLLNVLGKIADVLLERKIVSKLILRKVSATIGLTGTATMIVLIGLLGSSLVAIVVIDCCAYCFFSFAYTGYLTNALDLSQNYTDNVVGVLRAVENFASLVAPLVFSAVLTDPESLESWTVAFTVVAVPIFLCNIVFVVFGKASRQPWDKDEDEMNAIHP